MRAALRSLVCALLALQLQGCEGEGSYRFQFEGTVSEAVADARLPATAERSLAVAHAGVRRVEVRFEDSVLEYRERVVTDGTGRFALEPLEALTPVGPDWLQRQSLRSGYLFRYRDFAIREPRLFSENWRWKDLGVEEVVAGRRAARHSALRVQGEPRRYELAIDVETGLVLAAEELDEHGRRLSYMRYESFDPRPDLASVVWFQGLHDERPLASLAELEEELGHPLPKPRLLPQPFAAHRAYTLRSEDGTRRIKLVYSDGVESVFFLVTLPGDEVAEQPAPRLVTHSLGSATVVELSAAGWHLLAVGKADVQELADMVQSALPE